MAYPNATEAQVITLPASSCEGLSSPFEISAPTPGEPDYPYLGLSTLSQSAAVLDPNENSTAGNYAVLLGTVSGTSFFSNASHSAQVHLNISLISKALLELSRAPRTTRSPRPLVAARSTSAASPPSGASTAARTSSPSTGSTPQIGRASCRERVS